MMIYEPHKSTGQSIAEFRIQKKSLNYSLTLLDDLFSLTCTIVIYMCCQNPLKVTRNLVYNITTNHIFPAFTVPFYPIHSSQDLGFGSATRFHVERNKIFKR